MLRCWLSYIGYSVNWMYTGFGIVLYAAVMLLRFSVEWPAHLPLVRGGGVSFMRCNLFLKVSNACD